MQREVIIYTGLIGKFTWDSAIIESQLKSYGIQIRTWKETFKRRYGIVYITCFQKHSLLNIRVNLLDGKYKIFSCRHGTTEFARTSDYAKALKVVYKFKMKHY